MSLRNALNVPVFHFSLDQMKKTTLPKAVDWCRLEKGAYKYPFFVIRTGPMFYEQIKVDSNTIPLDVEATVTHVSVEEIHPGIYRTKKTVAQEQPKEPREEILQHLQKMEKQPLSNEEDEKRTLEYLGSRENMKNLSGFFYKEHLSFSAMDSAAKSNPDFPVG
uniref:Uncharacterized protein n=1 Tax=Panagrolaimus sp. PS1159 TaxID=55785 RepID=A0AC35F1W6_9BILA